MHVFKLFLLQLYNQLPIRYIRFEQLMRSVYNRLYGEIINYVLDVETCF